MFVEPEHMMDARMPGLQNSGNKKPQMKSYTGEYTFVRDGLVARRPAEVRPRKVVLERKILGHLTNKK